MTLLHVSVDGCDDTTYALIDVTEDQAEAIRLLAVLITQNSEVGCQPRMSVRPATPKDLEPNQ